ncbi:MAG: TniQ family protein [Anaerolineae bacterium]|nr:TniQ family protein [Anaerolineae bacterium]
MNLRPFLYRPPLLPNETLASYLYRLAYVNGHKPGIVATLCEEYLWRSDSVMRPKHNETFDALAALTQLEPYKIYWASIYGLTELVTPRHVALETICFAPGFTFPRMPEVYRRAHFRSEGKAQFCPHCLAEAAYQRGVWQLKVIAACPQHRCLLVDACPQCGQAIETTDLVSAYCHRCRCDLRTAVAIDLSGDEVGLQAQSILYCWARAGAHTRSTLPREPGRELYGLFVSLLRMVFQVRQEMEGLHPFPALSRPLPWHRRPERRSLDYYVAGAMAMGALLEWPEGFHSFLERFSYRDGRVFTVSLKSQLGHLFSSDTLELWQQEAYAFVYEAFLDYVAAHTAWPVVKKYPHFQEYPIPAKRFSWMLVEEVAQALGVTERTVKRLVEGGLIRVKGETAALRMKFLARVDVLALQERWRLAIPLADAAVWLGVSGDVVKHLVAMGLLTAARRPRVAGSASWQIDREGIDRLLVAVKNAATTQIQSGRERVNLTVATQMLAAYGVNAAQVVELVIRGRLRAQCSQHQALDGLVFGRRHVLAFLEGLRDEQGFVSRRLFAQRMRVKPEVIEGWVELGLLTPAYRNDEGTYFSREVVEAFAGAYVGTKEAMRILSVGPLTVQKWARNGRLRPVSGPGVDSRSVYLFRRVDVERLSPANRLTLAQLAGHLGVSVDQVRVWVKEGRVRPFSGPGVDDCGRFVFLKTDISLGNLNNLRII